MPVVIASGGPWPGREWINSSFSLFHFTEGTTISLDGNVIKGEPYIRDIGHPTIGGDRSSCIFPLSETFVEPSNLVTAGDS